MFWILNSCTQQEHTHPHAYTQLVAGDKYVRSQPHTWVFPLAKQQQLSAMQSPQHSWLSELMTCCSLMVKQQSWTRRPGQ